MQREKRNLDIGGHSLEIFSYLTGKENRDYQAILMGSIKVDRDQNIDASNINSETFFKAQDYLIKTIVVNLDGSGENVGERILELPATISNQIIAEISKVAGLDDKKKE